MTALVYDIFRLFIGPWSATPRGIDRIDLAYAQHLFNNWPDEIAGVMPTPWGVRLYDRALVLRGLKRLADIWGEHEADGEDLVLTAIKARLRGETPRALPPRTRTSPIARQWRMIQTTGIPLGRPVTRVPRGALYLNVGQLGWAAPLAMGWLRHRPDVQTILMLHDAIPIERPDLVSSSGAAAHRQMMKIASRRIDGLITTTLAAQTSTLRELAARGATPRRRVNLPLPIAPGFLVQDPPDDELRALNYFVICGAIEPRKNHALLLEVWRRLIARWGEAAPKLIVAGATAQGAAPVLAEMSSMPGQVIHATGLSTQGLRRLIRSAQALLMPSFAEGFGLPVQEALALGTPVIASDIPAHCEIAGGLARLLPPDDQTRWIDAILAPPSPPIYHPMQAGAYFDAVDQWLAGFSHLQQNEDCGAKSSLGSS